MIPYHRVLFVLTLFLLTASVTYADGLVPCGGPSDLAMCRACDFVVMAQKIMVWFVAISASIVALMFAFGGMKMVMSAGNTGQVSEGKEMMTNSVIGFLILLGAWLVVNTVLVTVMSDGKGIEIWGEIECVDNPTMSATNTGTGSAVNTGTGSAVNTGTAGAGTIVPLSGYSLTTSQSDTSLQTNYTSVNTTYATQIAQSCQGSSIPNCTTVVTALIANESQGKPGATSPAGALGIMQLLPSNGGTTCAVGDTSCIQGQIDLGVKKLSSLYTSSAVSQSIPNTLAAYNAGQATGEGQSASGLRPALAPSQDCAGLLAYQCTTNPGGLIETQKYVANICRTLTLYDSKCQ